MVVRLWGVREVDDEDVLVREWLDLAWTRRGELLLVCAWEGLVCVEVCRLGGDDTGVLFSLGNSSKPLSCLLFDGCSVVLVSIPAL